MKIKVLLILFSVLLLASCSVEQKKATYIFNEGWVFGTIYHITYYNPNEVDLHEQIKTELHRFNSSLSTFSDSSIISKVNQNVPVVLDSLFMQMFNEAQRISIVTNGAFDITVAPLVNAWGFGFKKEKEVTQSMIDSILPLIGYDRVFVDSLMVRKEDRRMMLDASAIAKGLAVDVIGQLLDRNGVDNYVVEIGGEITTKGISPKGWKWRVGIDKPIDDPSVSHRELQQIIELSGQSLATSGNYRNFYYKDGKKYAHTIDPITGFPVQHSLLSSSVVAKDCMTADAFATAFMVMGWEKALDIVEKENGVEAYFIYSDGDTLKTICSKGFEAYYYNEFEE